MYPDCRPAQSLGWKYRKGSGTRKMVPEKILPSETLIGVFPFVVCDQALDDDGLRELLARACCDVVGAVLLKKSTFSRSDASRKTTPELLLGSIETISCAKLRCSGKWSWELCSKEGG